MKTLAKCLGSVALVLVLMAAWFVLGARLQVSVVNETIVPASEEPELFAQAMADLRSGALGGDVFVSAPEKDISEYSFVILEMRVGSFGLLPCEWITAGVTPLPGDIALVQKEIPDVGPLGRARAEICILADAAAAQTGHGAWIEYYAFGIHTYRDARS